MYPITIKIPQPLLASLSDRESGSYEDMEQLAPGERCRPLESHTHKIALRHQNRLVIENDAEAEDAYFAVCSGTFQREGHAEFRAACKIADALRDIVRAHAPETVAMWPAPYQA
jgi:hypothetical protein